MALEMLVSFLWAGVVQVGVEPLRGFTPHPPFGHLPPQERIVELIGIADELKFFAACP